MLTKMSNNNDRFAGVLTKELIISDIKSPIGIIDMLTTTIEMCICQYPYTARNHYRFLREYAFPDRHKFPENYIETIIRIIQDGLKSKYAKHKEAEYNFYGIDNDTLELNSIEIETNNFEIECKEAYKTLKEALLPEKLVKKSMEYAKSKSEKSATSGDLIDLAQEFLNKRQIE